MLVALAWLAPPVQFGARGGEFRAGIEPLVAAHIRE
jgi:hypothetical protein